jgi:hypothetical protein
MRSFNRYLSLIALASLYTALPSAAVAHTLPDDSLAGSVIPGELPDAPTPQNAPQNVAQDGSQSGSAQSQPSDQKTEHDKAEQQIKAQEKQRVAGIVPSFNVSYISDAAPLSGGQKIKLTFRSQIDPYAFGLAAIVAGIGELKGNDSGLGWGAQGYFKRVGASYLDAFDGAMIGNGFLPALLHQDPRYFRLGHGSFSHRILYAMASTVICRHDRTGKWEPNYSNIGGNFASGAISNLYYPKNTGIGHTISDGLTVTAEGTFGGILQEFWPDVARKFFHRDPTNGHDAEMRAQDKAKKQAAQSAQKP